MITYSYLIKLLKAADCGLMHRGTRFPFCCSKMNWWIISGKEAGGEKKGNHIISWKQNRGSFAHSGDILPGCWSPWGQSTSRCNLQLGSMLPLIILKSFYPCVPKNCFYIWGSDSLDCSWSWEIQSNRKRKKSPTRVGIQQKQLVFQQIRVPGKISSKV